jgi:very-short-patch-repair endonuclease
LIAKRARAFRRALTEPEVMLWSRLKGRGRDKPIFRRQYAFGTIIFDFYCVPAKLAVEIDGSIHWSDEKRAKDEARDAWAMRQGIAVLRIGAGEVYRDLGGVTDGVIQLALERMGSR